VSGCDGDEGARVIENRISEVFVPIDDQAAIDAFLNA
jgi:hypothetical protein